MTMTPEEKLALATEIARDLAKTDYAGLQVYLPFGCGTALLAIERMEERVRAESERCARIAEETAEYFMSEEYATGQPLSSFDERFACKQVAKAIRETSHEG
jgi:hypothetical protein